jgi:ribosomal protein S18 acetylase RimI-like enzyme
MESNFFKIKPYDESLGYSVLVDLYNQLANYLNPEPTFILTEELARLMLGTDTVLSRDYLTFESKQGEIVAIAGISKIPIFKDALYTVYGVRPEYIDSEIPGVLIDTVLKLKKELNVQELIFQTFGEQSAPFDEKLKNLGFTPVNFNWSMCLDDFDLFSHPGVPPGITLQNVNELDDYTDSLYVINEAFATSFKFKPFTKITWKKLMTELKKNRVVEHCIAYEKEKMIGFLDAYINPEQENKGLIANFGILPAYQHRKIGSALLASGIETLINKGCKLINLSVDTTNEKALGLYKKFGFYIRKNLTQRTYQIM